jgi:chorismate dehydratase
VVLDHPATLCVQLASGELDVALVSTFEFLRNPIYRIVDDVSVSSAGPVYSVFVAHHGDISEVEEIELDPASQTSVNLLRCLLGEHGLNPRFAFGSGSTGCQPVVAGNLPATSDNVPCGKEPIATPRQAAEANRPAACAPQTTARLLIGDQAIRFRQEQGAKFKYWDLGEQWSGLDGLDLPFVYALWLVRPEVSDPKSIGDRLRALRDENLAGIDGLIAEEKGFDPDFCARYYRENLRFTFGEKEKEGLRKFQGLCEKHSLLPKRYIDLSLV